MNQSPLIIFRFLSALLFLGSNTLVANPVHRSAFEKHFGSLLASELQGCKLCHLGDGHDQPSSLDEFPHNPFGDHLRRIGEDLSDSGEDDSIANRFENLADADSDQDGVTNLTELLLGSHPGNKESVPDAEQLHRKDQLIAAYEELRSGYTWRPFDVIKQPAVPVMESPWGNNPIDAFIYQRSRTHELTPVPEADPQHLLRRVYLDLIGLQPKVDEIEHFTSEYARDPSAYDRVVDRLLEHPGYGERWGRHWMDIWRYSDWSGYKDALRESQRHIWHWRDWIVESLNEDLGYDQMLTRMLAADELQLIGKDLRATGYLARNYHTNRDQWLDNLVKHTSQAFMGVTVGCAKCHDHMSDPFPQTDYYALRAIFEPHAISTDRISGELDIAVNGIPRAYDRSVTAKTYLFARGDERFPDKEQSIPPGVPTALGGNYVPEPISISHTSANPDQREFVRRDLLDSIRGKQRQTEDEAENAVYQSQIDALEAEFALEQEESNGLEVNSERWKELASGVLSLQRLSTKATASWELKVAEDDLNNAEDALKKAESTDDASAISKASKKCEACRKALTDKHAKQKAAVETLNEPLTTKFTRRKQTSYPSQSSGRRLAFARWLVSSSNPLTARVAVNHLWNRHFGRGIVASTNDFGNTGATPTHPDLLDWLAAELMKQRWSMKAIHRLICTSATYRMASSTDRENALTDPDNQYFWRRNVGRMEGEIVRDNLLYISGRLDQAVGGADIDPKLAQESPRRSIYLRHAHEKLVEFIQIFDGPSVTECYDRENSIQPHQALALINSQLSVNAAKAVCEQVDQLVLDDQEFVTFGFLKVLGRNPSPKEMQHCISFLATNDRFNLTLVLLNHNDFVTIR